MFQTLSFSKIIVIFTTLAILQGCRGNEIRSGSFDGEFLIKSAPVIEKPIKGFSIEPHPFLAPQELSTIHSGGYNSDVHSASGPLGINPKVISRQGSTAPGGMYATTTFDNQGLMIVFMGSFAGFELNLLEPRSLKLLAKYDLPQRPSTFEGVVKMDADVFMKDTSSSYFYLDQQGYAVIADSTQHIQRLGHRQKSNGDWEFFLDQSWDISGHVPNDCMSSTNWFPSQECDPITSVTPDHNGLIWWVTLHGRIGTLNPETDVIKSIQLENEEIQNSFAAARDGIYIVSDYAMYGFKTDKDGAPLVVWREQYDRGDNRKLGAISQGAGSTPTLLGDDYVVIADNADPKVNLLVYRRRPDIQGKRLVCKVPLFNDDKSAVEISMIAWNRSIITKNDYGYTNAFQQETWDQVVGGFTRIDIREDESGCDIFWTSPEISPSVVPKLSAGNGLVYSYTFETQSNGENIWYLMALESSTGKTAFKIRTGAGSKFDGNWGPLAIGPDGTAYITVYGGMISIWDQPLQDSLVTHSSSQTQP